MELFKKTILTNYLYMINFIAIIGTLASLYFSEVEELAPCNLCWIQRIFFYPVVIISFVALAYNDMKVYRYIFPLAIPGMLIGMYHYYIQYFTSEDGSIFCSADNPCTVIDVEYFGFITIPLLSFLGFLGMTIISGLYVYFTRQDKK